MARPTDTIAALATPAGRSALAVIRISGSDTERLAREIFGEVPPPRTARRGDYRDRAGVLLDDVVFTVFREPNSYSGEDALEISCHGSPLIAQKALEDLFARGCRPAEPGEFTRRAFLNGRIDLSQAEAVMDLIHARSERALAAAHRQLRGALGGHLRILTDGVLDGLARIEAHIDFPDEDLPAEDLDALRVELEKVRRGTARLLATRRYGDLLRDGVKTVIVGEPNAGKSSLLNRLVGRERALVSAEPGTTRDFIEEAIAVGPHCLRLIDTAGLNPSPAALEKLGIEKTFECIEEADLILFVLDATRPTPAFVGTLGAGSRKVLAVLNKVDLLRGPAAAVLPAGIASVAVSALTGDGIDDLRQALIAAADSFQEMESGGESVAINARHAHALAQASDCLTEALRKLESKPQSELLASDLRGALDAFGEISGRIDHEQVLDRLFASFCIGK
jgi:tRNA modification GTPase